MGELGLLPACTLVPQEGRRVLVSLLHSDSAMLNGCARAACSGEEAGTAGPIPCLKRALARDPAASGAHMADDAVVSGTAWLGCHHCRRPPEPCGASNPHPYHPAAGHLRCRCAVNASALGKQEARTYMHRQSLSVTSCMCTLQS